MALSTSSRKLTRFIDFSEIKFMTLVNTPRLLLGMLFFALLVSCGEYNIKLNDRVVYTPDALFTDYQIADTALAECVAKHITTQNISHAIELLELNCQDLGITSLSGLERFHALQYLDLSDNTIVDTTALTGLEELRSLNLSRNALENVAALGQLHGLRYVGLTGNNRLLCASIQFAQVVELDLPRHCGTH